MEIDIAELTRLHAAGTQGEWRHPGGIIVFGGDGPITEGFGDINEAQADAAWIAAAHNAWPEIAAEFTRLRSRVAELETDPSLNTAWIRGIANTCKEAAERQRAERKGAVDDDSRRSIVESALSIGREDVYSTMHVCLSGWADKFERQAGE